VSVIPQEIPDLGSSQVAPRQNPQFSPGAGFTTEDYFVWSRIDGRTSLREVILMVGLGIEKAIGILRKLRRSGAVLMPGEDPAAVAAMASAPQASAPQGGGPGPGAATGARPEGAPAPRAAGKTPAGPGTEADSADRALPLLDPLTPDEERILAEDVALQEHEKRRIIQMMRLVAGSDPFALLGVERSADRRALKRAYYRLSKEFHPDRHYKQKLGTFGPLLSIIFENATQAFEELSDEDRRAARLAALADPGGAARATGSRTTGNQPAGPAEGSGPVRSPTAQRRSQHAVDLFSRACEREVAGDQSGALRLFRAAIQIDSQPRYLRRAAKCALAAGQLAEAQTYAEKAVRQRGEDASYARLMSDVLRAAGRLEEAEQVLLRALELPSTSDALMRELQGDLAAVRAARAAPAVRG
jgi:tetratricopeptide (TPR) repeat protein